MVIHVLGTLMHIIIHGRALVQRDGTGTGPGDSHPSRDIIQRDDTGTGTGPGDDHPSCEVSQRDGTGTGPGDDHPSRAFA